MKRILVSVLLAVILIPGVVFARTSLSDLEQQITDLQSQINNLQPDGIESGDMLYWNGNAWALTPAPLGDPNSPSPVLTLIQGVPTWTSPTSGSNGNFAPDGPITGTLGAIDVANNTFTLITTQGDHCVTLDTGAHGFQITTTATGFFSKAVILSGLTSGQQVDVYGPQQTNGCYLAHDVLAQDPGIINYTATEDTITGTLGAIDVANNTFTLITTQGDRCVTLDTGAHGFQITTTATGFFSKAVILSGLTSGQQVDVYGPLQLNGCYRAHDVLAAAPAP